MSANPPTPPEYEDYNTRIEARGGRIEVLLQWIRQDLNGVLEQQRITNGRIGKAENAIHDLQMDNEAAKKQHEIFAGGVEEWKVLKGQIAILRNGSVIIIILQILNILLDKLI